MSNQQIAKEEVTITRSINNLHYYSSKPDCGHTKELFTAANEA